MEQISLYEKTFDLGNYFDILDLDRYGSKWNKLSICKAVEEKDESFKEFLMSLNTYGAYDMLVAICEIVFSFCSDDIQYWFNKQLSQCADSEMVLEIMQTFHKSKVVKTQKNYAGIQDESEWILLVNLPEFEKIIWENYDPNFIREIARNNPRNIGVWSPGIYVNPKIDKYMKKLEDNAFPYLIMCAKDIREGGSGDKVQEALVRKGIADYLCELSLLYYSKIEWALNPLLEMDPKLVAESNYNKYAQTIQNILQKVQGVQLYITDTMADCLCEMIHLSEYFGDYAYRRNVLEMKVFLPLFYQLLGREEEAYNLLIDNIKCYSKGVIIRKEYLLVFYRSLLITKDEAKRQRLIGIFDELYLNNSAIREFIVVATHINIFYRKYCEDILVRKKILEEPKFFKKNKEHELFTRWFASKLVSEKFESLLCVMKKDSEFQKCSAIEDFIKLFYSLVSHRESLNIRITPYKGAKLLGDDYSWDSFDEIYGFYTEEERQQICVLAEQMEKVMSRMPSFDWQQYYIRIKQNAESFWNMDGDSVLCSKLLTAFRGIQSDPYNKWEYDKDGNVLRKRAEDSINNLVAFFLKAYYGEENIHREETQGVSGNEDKLGEIDILIFQNGKQLAIQEALKLESLDKTKLDDHMNRMLNNYDTQGVPVTCLVIYAYKQQGKNFFTKVEDYLKDYIESDLFTYDIVEKFKKETVSTANICHNVMSYRREEMLQKMHVFTVLM